MKVTDFYDIIDARLTQLIAENDRDEVLKKHQKSPDNQKSYMFLIWFMQEYGGIANYQEYVTDGNNDHSFDIVFDRDDHLGSRIFYIVQAKWHSKKNCEQNADKDEVLRAMQEFQTVLQSGFSNANATLQKQLEALKEHRKRNGEVRFVFLTLSKNGIQQEIQDNINAFLKNNPHTKFEIIDIDRLRLDYIDKTYKKITPLSIFRTYYLPEEEEIKLEVERMEGTVGTFIKVQQPFVSYIFLLRPKTLHHLFNRYGFFLFHKNVRNPLLESSFNKDIEETALTNPDFFWYYNNGITAICSQLPKAIANEATSFKVWGLQIINGAQTVYSLYRAYEQASKTQRSLMNKRILVTLRLVESANSAINIDITRYTNSQNPIEERDFWANDPVQIRLQEESYNGNVWYEKRRGEFRNVPEGIKVVPNTTFTAAYVAFYLQKPYWVIFNYGQMKDETQNLFFISHKKNPNGLYEQIFGNGISFEQMEASRCMFVIAYRTSIGAEGIHSKYYPNLKDFFNNTIPYSISLSKLVLQRYFELKFNTTFDDKSIVKKVIELFQKQNFELLTKAINRAIIFINNFLGKEEEEPIYDEKLNRLFNTPDYYEVICESFRNTPFSLEDVDNVALNEDQLKEIEDLKSKSSI